MARKKSSRLLTKQIKEAEERQKAELERVAREEAEAAEAAEAYANSKQAPFLLQTICGDEMRMLTRQVGSMFLMKFIPSIHSLNFAFDVRLSTLDVRLRSFRFLWRVAMNLILTQRFML